MNPRKSDLKALTNLPDYQSLGTAKQRILELLWPMEWVDGKTLLRETDQSYYDRRVRELRESGWQIETVGSKYRLTSHKKLPGNERQYPSAKQKREVFTRDEGICQICKEPDDYLQYDHKVPQERYGPTTVENLQLLCRECNVVKRGACKRCELDTCAECPYAYPEAYGTRIIALLQRGLAQKLRDEARQLRLPDAVVISDIIRQHYQKS